MKKTTPCKTYDEENWYIIEDPETVRSVLEALGTVRIGGVSKAQVGGEGRQLYDFTDKDSGSTMSFWFFRDTFYSNGESYDVLDWGDLKDIDLKKAAACSGG